MLVIKPMLKYCLPNKIIIYSFLQVTMFSENLINKFSIISKSQRFINLFFDY